MDCSGHIVVVLLLLAGALCEIRADESEIAAVCRSYLSAERGEQDAFASRLNAYKGDIDEVIRLLSEQTASDHRDVSGELLNQTFTARA